MRKHRLLIFYPDSCNESESICFSSLIFLNTILLLIFFIKHYFSRSFIQLSFLLIIYLALVIFCLRFGNLFVPIFIDSSLRVSYLGNCLKCIFLTICSIKSLNCLLSSFICCSTKLGTSKQTCPAYFLL